MVHLLVELVPGDVDLLGVDDDDEVAGVDVRGVLGLALAAQRVGDLRRKTPEGLPLGVDEVPAASDLARLQIERFLHTKKRRTGARRGGMVAASRPALNAAAPAVRGVPDVRRAGHLLREPADGDEAAAARDTFEKRRGSLHLGARRPPIRIRAIGLVWMCRDDVPEEDVVLEPELREHAVDDRRARLGRPGAGELALGGERDPGDARPAVPGGLADQHDRRVALRRRGRRSSRSRRRRERQYWLNVSPIRAAARSATSVPSGRRPRAASTGTSCASRRGLAFPAWPTVTTPTISRSSGIPSSSRSRSLSSPTRPKSPAPSPSSTAARSRSIIALPGVDPPPGDAPLDLLAVSPPPCPAAGSARGSLLAHRDDDVDGRPRDPRLEAAASRTRAPGRARRSARACLAR